jgi:ribonuclease P protein component
MARLTKRVRMRDAGDFTRAFECGGRLTEGPFTAVIADSKNATPRLGLAVPRKAVPLAAQRSRVKRQVRESFRHCADRLPHVDIVIVARGGAGKSRNAVLREALSRLWTRIAKECRAS